MAETSNRPSVAEENRANEVGVINQVVALAYGPCDWPSWLERLERYSRVMLPPAGEVRA